MDTIAERMTQAVQLHEAGKLGEAEALYRAVLQAAPQHPHALHLLGVLAHQRGRLDEAVDLIRRALAVHGPHAVFYSNLAAVLVEIGRLEEAAATARHAIVLQPNLAIAHNNFGMALLQLGRHAEAAEAFHRAERLSPGYIDARCNLGLALHRLGRPTDAVTVLEETVRVAPQNARAQHDLGAALLACERHAPAAERLREAIRLRPTFADAHGNLALALQRLGCEDEALASSREAVRLNPQSAAARCAMAYMLEGFGRFDEARAEFETALSVDPNSSRALAGLAGLAEHGHHQLDDTDVARLRELLTRTDLPPEDVLRVHYALARALDNAGACDEAFEHYRQANELRKRELAARGIVFDRTDFPRQVDRLIDVFSRDFLARTAGWGMETDLPVFVVGMMRSGTTLAEQILASHPQVFGAGELTEITALLRTLPEQLATADEYPQCMRLLGPGLVRGLAGEHLAMLQRRGGTAARVVDKTPVNGMHLGLIATLFSQARVVHCRRNPIDTCLSCYCQNFARPHPYTLDLADLGVFCREFNRLMAYWSSVLPLRLFELDYEHLTADQEPVSRRLVAHLGLDWDERCLRFYETERPVRTASLLQVRKPMYQSAVGRWKRYEKHLQPLLEALSAR
jgi:Flp pilus assembly protein TadD